jgi:sulfonate transport system substrate-binding protein
MRGELRDIPVTCPFIHSTCAFGISRPLCCWHTVTTERDPSNLPTMRLPPSLLTVSACTLAAVVQIGGCSKAALTAAGPAHASLALDASLPRSVSTDTELVIGDPITQRVLEQTGWIKQLHFKVRWARITGGPNVTEAFHAKALDVGLVADVPPIHARWVGIPVKIIAVQLRRDPVGHPLYVIGVAPHAAVTTLADLRGKRIAFSPGQVQGEVVLRTLREQGLTARDVTLVELPSVGDAYLSALASGSVDAAPIAAGALSKRYLDNYSQEGAKVLRHGPFRDDLTLLYVREETLRDPGKAAALTEYVGLWLQALEWTDAHPAEWASIYWSKDQGLSAQDAHYQVETYGVRYAPTDWAEAIAIEQSAIDLLGPATSQAHFDAATLFDRRFERLTAELLRQ